MSLDPGTPAPDFTLEDQEGIIVDLFESPNLGTPREKAAYEAALAKL